MLRVNRFAAAIDMIAAGTSAPIATAAKATPANQDGNTASNSAGTACCALPPRWPLAVPLKPAARAM